MSFFTLRYPSRLDWLKKALETYPLAKQAMLSAALHGLLICGLLLLSLGSCQLRSQRYLSPFDLQSLEAPGRPGEAGPAAASPAPTAPALDGLEILKPQPVRPKAVPNKPAAAKPPAAPARNISKSEVQKLLGAAMQSLGTSQAASSGTGRGGGHYDPLSWYYANVRATMYEAWQQPSALAGQQGLVSRALIRIQRDGRIIKRSLIQSSGNAQMDNSVMAALESVARLQELPPGFAGAYKEIAIDFELMAPAY